MEDTLKDYIKDMTIDNVLLVIKTLTIEIDKYYIKRSEHEKIVKELEERIKDGN